MTPAAPRALRLRFEHAAGVLRLASRTPLDAVVPPADPPASPDGEQGFWLELRDAADRALFRRVLHDPLPAEREVFAERAGARTITRASGAPAARQFTVLVPNAPGAVTVALFSSEHTQPGPAAPDGGVPLAHRGAQPGAPRAAQLVARFALGGAP